MVENLVILAKFRGGVDLALKNLSMAFLDEARCLIFLVVIHTVNK